MMFRGEHARPGRSCAAGGHMMWGMDLEEKSVERPADLCEECGARLTPAELQAAMEAGGPALCSMHADEVIPLGEDEAEFGEE